MGLEIGTYIDDLNESNPLSTDKRRQGDDHLRLIKSVLKNTFPNASGVISPTPTEFNYLVGTTSSVQTQLDAKLATADLDALILAYNYAATDVSNAWSRTQALAPVNLGNVSGLTQLAVGTTDSYIMTLVGNTTLSLTGSQAGQGLTLKIIQGSGGGFTITWPTNWHFPNKTEPTLSTTAGDYDIVVAKQIGGNYVGNLIRDLG